MWEELSVSHWKRALKLILKGTGFFQFTEAVITFTAKENLCSTECISLEVLTVL